MNKDNTRLCWHGKPVKTEFGSCLVKENTEKILCWYNYEACKNSVLGALIPAIRVTTESGYSFVIANHFGIGWLKLKRGGWPGTTHFSLPEDSFQPEKMIEYNIRKFDEQGWSEHEAARERWFKEQYSHTEEWKQSQALKKLIQKR
jgi:hypothetical protein